MNLRILIFILFSVFTFGQVDSTSIINTPHNIDRDTTGVGLTLCRNCHLPYSKIGVDPLWQEGQVIDSLITIDPNDLCLGCHDGSIAKHFPKRSANVNDLCCAPNKNLILHNFSMFFDCDNVCLPAKDSPIIVKDNKKIPCTSCHELHEDDEEEEFSSIEDGIQFCLECHDDKGYDHSVPANTFCTNVEDSKIVHCVSCHDPHINDNGKFLRMKSRTQLCLECHKFEGYQHSVHGNPINPFYPEIYDIGCDQCHNIHLSPALPGLLLDKEMKLCFSCHDGSNDSPKEIASEQNILYEFQKPYLHPIFPQSANQEDFSCCVNDWNVNMLSDRSVTCSDCHNVHSASEEDDFGLLDGSLRNVKGVDSFGFEKIASREYEICYKCHGAAQNITFETRNVADDFDIINRSFHPVEAPGRRMNLPGLKDGWSEISLMNCTDCHGNDDEYGIPGPHGSIYEGLLKHRFERTPFMINSVEEDNALCFTCHSQDFLLGNAGFNYHSLHIEKAGYNCSACHDPHGSRTLPGLLKLDHYYIQKISSSEILISELPGQGTCNLRCHGHPHNNAQY